ncbi:ribosome small subunit-dependent GTPase A [Iodobacter sp.]|uniref:ribosome small subunit-dependent GTPase A n=1 Tax=Iodobacter sp. TaxID=1915058 RepID=UPI0025CCC592|nr:ribosome small subunit-dependent GTPase A [Iodobacter sp.]
MIENIDIAQLRAIGFDSHVLQTLSNLTPQPQQQLGRVINIQRDHLQLHDGQHKISTQLLPALQQQLHASGATLAVGDWVLFQSADARITQILPAKNRLCRRNSEGHRQALVANIDVALLVMGLDHDFNLRRLDRYLTLTLANEVTPLLVLTKADCSAQAAEKIAQARSHLPAHLGLLAIDGRADKAREALHPWLAAGQTVVLLGSSGAGKSTLTNTLLSTAVQNTGAVRLDDSRGRHTTTSRSLHLCQNDVCIIDTPGLRTLQLDSDEAGIYAAFADITTLAVDCRYRDCQHKDEPDCAVRAHISPDRLKSFHKLLREFSRETMTVLQKRAQLSQWKTISKNARAQRKAS